RDSSVTGVQTCALPICAPAAFPSHSVDRDASPPGIKDTVNALRRALDAAAALAAVGVVVAALATEGTRPAPLAAALFTLLLFARSEERRVGNVGVSARV